MITDIIIYYGDYKLNRGYIMEEVWKFAISISGIAGIAAFVFFGLYKEWLNLPAFADLTKKQRFDLFKIFLILTFIFALAGLSLSAYQAYIDHRNGEASRVELEKTLESRKKEADDLFKEALNDPLLPLDPERKKRIEVYQAKYNRIMQDAINALDQKQLNLHNEKMKELNRMLYSDDFKKLLPKIDPTRVTIQTSGRSTIYS